MSDFVPSLIVVVTITLCFVLVQGRFEPWERLWLWGSLAVHFLAGLGQVLVVTNVYGGGDMTTYRRIGMLLAEFLKEYPTEGSYRLLQVYLQQPDVSLPVHLGSGATGSMQAVAGFSMLLLNDSLYAACIMLGGLSFFSTLAVYRVFRRELPEKFHLLALIGCLWEPSVVFWSSALLKESVALVGLGLTIYGGHALATRRRLILGLVLFLLGLLLAAPVKAYLLLPFGLAAGLWFYLDGARAPHLRRRRLIRPGAFLLGVVLSAVFVVGIGELFPRFEAAGLAEETAKVQAGLMRTKGGTDYAMGNPEVQTFSGQLAYAPEAILTALFRPTLLDIINPQTAVNALESTGITVLLLIALVRAGPVGMGRAVLASPILGFAAVYVLGLALGVGLGTTNLGTLSRYRMPMMPFFVTLVAVLAHGRAEWIPTPTPVFRR